MKQQRFYISFSFVILLLILIGDASHAETINTLTRTALENVVSFVKLTNYIKYFYAGDAASENDWDTFMQSHVEEVEQLATVDQLRDRLFNLFSPYVPNLEIYHAASNHHILENSILRPGNATLVTTWVRIGLGEGSQGQLVPGRRIQVPVGTTTTVYEDPVYFQNLQTPITLAIPDPTTPFVANLSDDLVATFPLSVFSNEQGTLPLVSTNSEDAEEIPSARANRLAVVGQIWGIFQHLYPYWENAGIDWDNILRQTLIEAVQDSDEEFLTTLQAMTSQLGDAHTVTSQGRFTTIGAYSVPFTVDVIEDQLVVTTLLTTETPIQPGDIITHIDGLPAQTVIESALSRSPGMGQYKLFMALLSIMTGERNSALTLKIQSPNNREDIEHVVSRSYRSGSQPQFYWREYRSEPITSLDENVWYVDLTRISAPEVSRLVPRLDEATAMIFDMRGYPMSTAPGAILPYLTEQNLDLPPSYIPIFTFPDHVSITLVDVTTTITEPAGRKIPGNYFWLINGNRTYSYPETILAIVEGYDLGTFVGQSTAGASGDSVSVNLISGYRTSWTGLYVTKFDQSTLFRIGIDPDIFVDRTIDAVAHREDEILEQALALALLR